MIRKFEETPEWWAEYDSWKVALRPDIRKLYDTVEQSTGHGGMDDEGTYALMVLAEMATLAMYRPGDRVVVNRSHVMYTAPADEWLSGVVQTTIGTYPNMVFVVDLDEPYRASTAKVVTQLFARAELMRPAP